MKYWSFLGFSIILLYVSHGEGAESCNPGAILAHPKNCTMYYICDADGDLSLFVCPLDQLYNPVTTNCDLANRVTCVATKGGEQKTTTVEIPDEVYEDDKKETSVEEKRQKEKETDHHKEFYFLQDSSGESSDMEESDKAVSSSKDGHEKKLYTNVRPAGEGKYTYIKHKTSKHIGEASDKSNGLVHDHSDSTLEESYDVKKVDQSSPELAAESYEPVRSEEDYESEKFQDDHPKLPQFYSSDATRDSNVSEDTGDDYGDETDRLKKREASEPILPSQGDESEMEEKNEEGKEGDHKVLEERVGSVKPDEDLNVQENSRKSSETISIQEKSRSSGEIINTQDTPTYGETIPEVSINNETTQVKIVNGTNFLLLTQMTEPIANWTEKIENGWTDLQIFWKHPADKDFQGSLNIKYPSDSLSSTLEIKDLVLEVLQTEDETGDSDDSVQVEEAGDQEADQVDTVGGPLLEGHEEFNKTKKV